MLDIGGGTTDIAIFQGGTIKHTAVIPIAGDQVTNDIAIAIQTPTQAAEELKKKFGCALAGQVGEDESIDAPSIGGKPSRKLLRHNLAAVIEPRMEEIFVLAQNELRRSGFEGIVTSVVITGGSSKIEAAVELAEEVFHMPVRLGLPNYEGSLSEMVLNPIYSTGTGLVKFGHKGIGRMKRKEKKTGTFSEVLARMKGWFKGNF